MSLFLPLSWIVKCRCILEYPLGTKARTHEEALSGSEIVREFDLSTDIEVVNSEMLADVVPELWL